MRYSRLAGEHAKALHDELVAFSPEDKGSSVWWKMGFCWQEEKELRWHRPSWQSTAGASGRRLGVDPGLRWGQVWCWCYVVLFTAEVTSKLPEGNWDCQNGRGLGSCGHWGHRCYIDRLCTKESKPPHSIQMPTKPLTCGRSRLVCRWENVMQQMMCSQCIRAQVLTRGKVDASLLCCTEVD